MRIDFVDRPMQKGSLYLMLPSQIHLPIYTGEFQGFLLRFDLSIFADKAFMAALPAASGYRAGSLDLVLANPPYGVEGRPSPSHLRERAMRGAQGKEDRTHVLTIFCRAAAALLRHQGYFFCIYDALALPQLAEALGSAGFGLRGLLPVRAHAARPAMRVPFLPS